MTQDEALNILKTGANVFLTGEPGSGKTHTTNEYIAWLRAHGIEPAITASTGIAATHSNGVTIHSWSGIGVRDRLTPYDLDAITQDERRSKRLQGAKVLIIDEVSMLSSNIISMIDTVLREVRGTNDAFGGVQTILVGDFFQLPPIQRNSGSQNNYSYARSKESEETITYDEDDTSEYEEDTPRTHFAFGSPSWKELDLLTCYLSEQHRQEDASFLEILTAIRRNRVGDMHHQTLRERIRSRPDTTSTELYSHNVDVDRINERALSALPGVARTFSMHGKGAKHLVEQLKRGCLSPETLSLKNGAKVMFTKNNFEEGYVNGTLGVVQEFRDGAPIVETRDGKRIVVTPTDWNVEDNGKVLATISQLPLRLAWAITVHKSQGMSLDAAHMDLSKAFEYGQGYVALSRVRTLDGLTLQGINERALQIHPEIGKADIMFKKESAAAKATFNALPKTELRKLHEQFILSAGGTLKAQKAKAKQSIVEKKGSGSTLEATRTLLLKKLPIEKIADERGMKIGTVLSHIEELLVSGRVKKSDVEKVFEKQKKRFPKIFTAFKRVGSEKLKPVFDYFEGKVSYDDLKMARLLYKE